MGNGWFLASSDSPLRSIPRQQESAARSGGAFLLINCKGWTTAANDKSAGGNYSPFPTPHSRGPAPQSITIVISLEGPFHRHAQVIGLGLRQGSELDA